VRHKDDRIQTEKMRQGMSEIIVKVALCLYGIFALACISLVWKNAGASDAVKNASVIFASILPIAITVFAYLVPEKMERHMTCLLIYDDSRKSLTFGSIDNKYSISYIPVTANISATNMPTLNNYSDLIGPTGLNLIERGVVECLVYNFSMWWNFQTTSYKGFGGELSKLARGDNSDKTVIKSEKLKEIFSHNPIINLPEGVTGHQLCLPPASHIEIDTSEIMRKILIRNGMYSVEINILALAGGYLQRSIPGIIEIDPINPNRFAEVLYLVDLVGKTGIGNANSTEMALYKNWFENVWTSISKLDWGKIEETIKQ
jgi:hypothetical protein